VVASRGSRNAPLLMAADRCGDFRVTSVIDERSAAFIALGIAEITCNAVALICTSGTALLNYAPAIAEAYYRNIPLIVISADRQAEWIDQNDSQTIRQPGALTAIVKGSYAFNGETENETGKWFVNRTLNEALTSALNGPKGPVHINIALAMPLTGETEASDEPFRKICLLTPDERISTEKARHLAKELQGKRVLIFGGITPPDARLNRAMEILGSLSDVTVMAEGLANLHCGNMIWNPETVMSHLSDEEAETLRPDVAITFGGAPTGTAWKKRMRQWKPERQWHVGVNGRVIDTYTGLTMRIEIPPEGFFPRLASAMRHLAKGETGESYNHKWNGYAAGITTYSAKADWSAPVAVRELLKSMPEGWNLQLSNGMSIRYALMNDLRKFHRIDCNRGVSGIDGSLSTAVGASMVYPRPTLLITGDMSAQYDIGALASTAFDSRLKIVVINNGGGGIFNFVKTTATLPERDRLFKCDLRLPLKQLAEGFGMRYVRATDSQSLCVASETLTTETRRPVIVEVVTDAETDARIMKQLLGEK
ncbi:MAG: 2-succinyl-5-enolpyruvyl-6-hydroxy-3-cyclohexene-1-carboxylic-acid synthase, partial [Muribaculaceae bacterium]|nr:2-succinyl-5-enolpyruvyl-6-hydroxy-3-cyclohexene-1-carboxylic-acid synthase [Muribaculaceae bacterium]